MGESWSILFLTKDYKAFGAYFGEGVGKLLEIGVRFFKWRHCQSPWICPGQAKLQKIDHFTTWLSGTFQKLWLFYPERQSQNKVISFLSGWLQSPISIGFSQGLCVPLSCFKSLEWCFHINFLLNSATGFSVKPTFAEFKKSFFFTILFARKKVWSFA